MKILDNMDLCYGCAACANICPTRAIAMQPAEDGFLYPVIDENKCVNCGACQRVCPQLHAEYQNDRAPGVFAAMADDDTRALSASGGVFSLLAEYALAQDGYVCGAVFADDFKSVHHTMIHAKEELAPLRRSKYIQSENGTIHQQVKEKLDAGSFVLFVGTPCQCASIQTYLGKPYENLLVVDLICHGTPSALAWNKFLEEAASNKEISDVNFRYKGLIGWSSTTHIEFKDGTDYTQRFKDCRFEQAFSGNLISRKSCGTCQFARVPRQGDITIGDFWDVHRIERALDDRKGTSAVLVNTEKGKKALENLSFLTWKEVPFYNAFVRNNSNVYRFSNTHPGRQQFFDALNTGAAFSDALSTARKSKYDIMLFSIWYAANFGSMMTNFALYKMLTDMGYNCVFADIPDHLWPTSRVHRDPTFITRRFGYKHFNITGKYKNRTDMKKVNDLADTFLVGSDQLWNYNLCKSAGTYFYLDFVDDNKKKIAYGTSFGHSHFRGNETERRTAGFYLNRFDAVSVREDYAVDLCKDSFGVDAVQVLDPVFMCSKQHYLSCVQESRLVKDPPKNKYLLAYILDPTEEKQRYLEESAKRMGADLLCIPNAQVKDDLRAKWRLPILENIDMEDWLYYFSHAEAVVTDSFHGTCFSVIFEKPFVAIGNEFRGLERFHSLLSSLQLTDRLVFSTQEAEEKDTLFLESIDYAKVNERLAELREYSMAWLRNALFAPAKAPVYSTYDLLDRRADQLNAQMDKRFADQAKLLETAGKNLETTLASLRKMETQLHTLQKKTEELQAQQTKTQAKLTETLTKLSEAQASAKKAQGKAKELQTKLTKMENSHSWKLTKPLRAFVHFFRKLFKK
ncbi:MAG: polysaccharide pyruvyl transferase family protein [Clostridia bacterium]|nr:polysaccharide pyruvyl transferase family protein [Clostridia bacterium]